MDSDKSLVTLLALRDFFMAQNVADLTAAYQRLATVTQENAPLVMDWPAVEFAFNRLFVGPKKLLAPPFASIYLDTEPNLMGPSTLKARYLYQMMGLTSPWQNALPDDHLGLELDAYSQLQSALERVPSSELESLRDYFLQKHLHRWLPRFINQVKAVPDTPAAIIFVVEQLAAWLHREMTAQAVQV